MIAVDTNILIYADRQEMPLHTSALSRLRALAEGDAAWALPVFCTGEFIRVVSHPRLFSPPTPSTEAAGLVSQLLSSPSARLLSPGPRYWGLVCDLIASSKASGNLMFDVQIAALCLEHGATLLTEDRDFSRFPDLRLLHL